MPARKRKAAMDEQEATAQKINRLSITNKTQPVQSLPGINGQGSSASSDASDCDPAILHESLAMRGLHIHSASSSNPSSSSSIDQPSQSGNDLDESYEPELDEQANPIYYRQNELLFELNRMRRSRQGVGQENSV